MASASAPSGVPRTKSASSVCIGSYTFRMKTLIWLALLGILAGLGYAIWVAIRKYGERQRAAEERFASFMAQTAKPSAPKLDPLPAAPKPAPASMPAAAPAADLAPQRLLLEAAA